MLERKRRMKIELVLFHIKTHEKRRGAEFDEAKYHVEEIERDGGKEKAREKDEENKREVNSRREEKEKDNCSR